MHRKALAGHVTGGSVFGYRNRDVYIGMDPHGRPLRSHVEREIDPAEAAIVRRIFELSAQGMGKTTIAKLLNADHAPAPNAGKHRPRSWSPSSVREVLFRDLYRGMLVWNRTKKRPGTWGAVNVADRPESDWVRVDMPQLRIVSDEAWRVAHARLEQSRRLYLRGTGGKLCGRPLDGVARKYLLVGLARCGICGGSIEVRSRRHGKRREQFYMCANHRRRGPEVCKGLEVPLRRADQRVLGSLEREILQPTILERVCQRVVDHFAQPAQQAATRRQELIDQRAALDRAISKLIDAIAAATESTPSIIAAIKAREREREAIDRQLVAMDQDDDRPLTMDQVRRVLDSLVKNWRAALLDEGPQHVARARQVVQKLVEDRVEFTPEAKDEQLGYRVRVKGTRVRVVAMAVNVDEATVA